MLKEKFERIGARAKVTPRPTPVMGQLRRGSALSPTRQRMISIDIGQDKKGEFFDIRTNDEDGVQVLDIQPQDRHLLLMARALDGQKQKYLCGHDERHWFVAAIADPSASNVETAKQALKPSEAVGSQKQRKVKSKNKHRRKNKGFVRQGEWFFMPVDDGLNQELDQIARKEAIKNEPIRRGRSKPHMCELLLRRGGRQVYVHNSHPDGVDEAEFRRLTRNSRSNRAGWRKMVRDASVHVKGRVMHPDHKTIVLDRWHKVVPNTENRAPWAENVVFLD